MIFNRLIWLVHDELMTVGDEQRGCTMINAVKDSDVDVVKAAVEALLLHTTILIREDRSPCLTPSLCHYVKPDCKNLYFTSDKFKGNYSCKAYNINRLEEIFGRDICSQLFCLC